MTLMRSVLSSSAHPIFDTRVTPTKLQVDGLDEVFGTHRRPWGEDEVSLLVPRQATFARNETGVALLE